MPLYWPKPKGAQISYTHTGRPGAAGTVTTVTASSTAHTLGSFAEVIASTAHDCYWLTIWITGMSISNTRTDGLLNIYVGASSAETLIISNLLAGWSISGSSGAAQVRTYQFPLYIPAGTRITAKLQSLISSDSCGVKMRFDGGSSPLNWCGHAVETLGANTASSIGTSVTPGTTSDGSFTDIGTTGFEYGYVLPMIQGTLSDTNMTHESTFLDIGNGGSLYRGLENFPYVTNGGSECSSDYFGGVGTFVKIPASTTLQLRGQGSSTAEAYDCCIYGVY